MQLPPTIIGLGELIWDLLPDGKQLGGAPTNFAYISRLLGNDSTVASRVGDDDLGGEALTKLARMGIATQHIQIDSVHPTGTVGVRIDERGEASFQVRTDSAWDFLELTDDWKTLAATADAVCFGTLGQRNAQARRTILDFLKLTPAHAVRVFDVNLRHSFFTPEMLRESLELATIVKLNSEELSSVDRMLGLNNTAEQDHDASQNNPDAALANSREIAEKALARELISRFELKLVAITHGESVTHPGFAVEVKDTIGGGDAFTASMVHHYLRGGALNEISEAANRTGAWICTQTGATPEIDNVKGYRV
jgi:fructokinase